MDYVQPYEVVPATKGRALDVAGSVILAVVGLAVVGGTSASQDTFWQPGDPYYEPPPDPTAGYVIGGGMMVGGAVWLIGSYAALPSAKKKAAVQHAERTWTSVEFVEATGCGLVPGDVAEKKEPAGGSDVEERLAQLEKLRKADLISEEEYEKKRKKILDEL